MADAPLLETLVNDLLSRVKKLEGTNLNDYVATLDRVMFSMTVSLDVLSQVLINNKLITKEDLEKLMASERDRITKEITDKIQANQKA